MRRNIVAAALAIPLVLLIHSVAEPQVAGCAPPTGVVVDPSCAAAAIDVTWTNGAVYDSIAVDVVSVATGALVASVSLPGTATGATVALPAEGRYEVTVRGTCVTGIPGSATVPAAVFPFPSDTTNAVVGLEGSGGIIDSALALENALDAISRETVLVDDILAFTCRDLMDNGTVLWVALGTWPNNHILTFDEGAILVERLLAGVSLYIEGGDHWGFDPPTPLRDYDGVLGTAASGNIISDGDDSLTALVGLSHGGLDFTGADAPYSQDSLGNDFTDRLLPTGAAGSPVDFFGANAGVVWQSSTGYGVAIYYLPPIPFVGDPPGKVLSSSFEFGGYQGDEEDGMQKMSDELKGIGGTEFERGDCNEDGLCDIGDAIYLLGGLFGGGATWTCEDACDSNDDDSLDIADAIWKLSFLFSGGPPPENPFGLCGFDGSPGTLGCVSFPPCP
jgi:hypothetical protein